MDWKAEVFPPMVLSGTRDWMTGSIHGREIQASPKLGLTLDVGKEHKTSEVIECDAFREWMGAGTSVTLSVTSRPHD